MFFFPFYFNLNGARQRIALSRKYLDKEFSYSDTTRVALLGVSARIDGIKDNLVIAVRAVVQSVLFNSLNSLMNK